MWRLKYSDMPCLLAGIRDDEQPILDELRRYFLWTQVECASTQRELLNALSRSQEQLLVLCERKDSATWVWDIQELNLTWLNLVRRLGQLFGEFADVSGQVGLCMEGMACDFDGKRPVFLQGSH
ncbi:Uncharacterised protein [Corynebacterium striatum]|nr:Uncharacterised protein [Corynebacterium striatum]